MKKARAVCLLVIGTMVLSLSACGSASSEYTEDSADAETTSSVLGVTMPDDYDEMSAEIYDNARGAFSILAFKEARLL
ncbi:MAG: hypothetical protein LIO80_07140 [Lachnospiraceae bacterium]|nr:hypothetical protein [Lachnospiraceae bacterium]